MTDCIRKGEFALEEKHKCFVLDCDGFCFPIKSTTCEKCNFKVCENGHCACHLSREAKYAIEVLYDTFCEFCEVVK